MKGFFEIDLHIVPQIRTAPGTCTSSAAECTTKDGLEYISDVAEVGTRLTTARSALLKSCVAITIVSGTFLRILENLIGGAHRLELAFAFPASRIAIRMVLHRQFAIGRLDRRPIGIAAHSEEFVKINFGR